MGDGAPTITANQHKFLGNRTKSTEQSRHSHEAEITMEGGAETPSNSGTYSATGPQNAAVMRKILQFGALLLQCSSALQW